MYLKTIKQLLLTILKKKNANILYPVASFSILTNIHLALKMRFGWKGLRLFHDFQAARVSKTAAVRKSDLFSCVVCLLSHLITLYSEIKNHPPRPAAGAPRASSLTGALGSMSLSSAPAGFVISGWVRADGDHLWNKDAEGRDREEPPLPERVTGWNKAPRNKEHISRP